MNNAIMRPRAKPIIVPVQLPVCRLNPMVPRCAQLLLMIGVDTEEVPEGDMTNHRFWYE